MPPEQPWRRVPDSSHKAVWAPASHRRGKPMAQITIQPEPTGFFIPPLVQGDADYKGHGPDTYLRVDLEVRNDTEVWAQVYMKARETKGDFTTAEGTEQYRIGVSAKRIIDILTSR